MDIDQEQDTLDNFFNVQGDIRVGLQLLSFETVAIAILFISGIRGL